MLSTAQTGEVKARFCLLTQLVTEVGVDALRIAVTVRPVAVLALGRTGMNPSVVELAKPPPSCSRRQPWLPPSARISMRLAVFPVVVTKLMAPPREPAP